jgi:serine phosphatase RsbU (regulator of sigma subunit)
VRVIDPEIRRLTRLPLGPARMLQALNAFTCAHFPDNAFITAACVQLDSVARTMTVANAGHVPPVLRRAAGGSSIVGVASGPPLGMLDGAWYQEQTCILRRGDIVLLMTDGVLEAVENDLITMSTLLDILNTGPSEPSRLNRRIFQEVRRGLRRPDDLTLLSLKYGDDVPSSAKRERPSATFERRASGVS